MTQNFNEKYEFRNIFSTESDQAIVIEQTCFPPNEADAPDHMKARVEAASDCFLVAVDKQTGKIAGFLNGIATDEDRFQDQFFMDCRLHHPQGKNMMLLGLDILPEYRRQGLAREIVKRYCKREKERGRKKLILTCLPEKVEMYLKFGFDNRGISDSTWGGESWYEMCYDLERHVSFK